MFEINLSMGTLPSRALGGLTGCLAWDCVKSICLWPTSPLLPGLSLRPAEIHVARLGAYSDSPMGISPKILNPITTSQ